MSAMLVSAGQKSWRRIAAGSTLSGGDQLRTEKAAKATLTFPDGSRIELGPQSNFTLDEASDGNSMHLGLGSLRAFIKHVVGKRFDVHTPTAVCSVRGTDFIMIVNEQGHTAVQMFTGILAVADHRGNEALLRDGDRLRVTDKGLSSVEHQAAGGTQGPADKLKEVAKREVGLQMSKEQVQAAAAIESKNAIFQEGKAIIDVNGNRVRIEEYIVRPRPTDFKLVVLDSRADRFDYFYYHGVFNQTLPDDISLALRMLPGCIGAACPFFLTSYDTGRSNTIDNMLEVSAGGHMIDVNNDGVAADKVTAAFDPKTNTFVGLTVNNPGVNDPANNQPFFQTLFNTNQLTFNGVMHTSWAPAGGAGAACGSPGNICSMGGAEVAFTNVTTVQNPPACSPPDCTYTEPGLIHQVVFSANGTGTIWDKFDSYIISDTGKVATTADFAGVTSGASYKSTLLKWNFEQIVTASEFHGRKIDLAVEPKIFIESGLIP
ncbi:MAG: FecR domain-containing protein [Elusimicrobia bacterium]|nr:FecR domain-containing protein [Elusimicrobiota bacterium]